MAEARNDDTEDGQTEPDERSSERLRESVGALRMWLESMPHLVCRDDDAFLLRFLRVAKFEQDRAQMMLDNYITIRKSRKGSPQWFDYPALDSPQMMRYLERPFLHLNLGHKSDGEAVYLSTMQFWDPTLMPFDELITVIYMTADMALVDQQSQIKGVTILVDLSQIGRKQLGFFENRRTILGLLRNWQDAFPVRIKSVIYLNEPLYFNVLFALIKGTPLLKQKLKDRLHKVGKDLEKLRRLLGPDEADALLPVELGGHNGSMEQLMEASKLRFHCAEVQDEWRQLSAQLLSEAERQYVYDSVQDAVRIDGRRCHDYRQAVLRCDLLCYATASAQVSLGDTEVLVSVREEASSAADAPADGPTGRATAGHAISVWADCGCLGNGPEQQQLADELQGCLASLYRCLRAPTPMFVDILLLGYDGNLLDAASLAACAALRRALPAEVGARVPLLVTVHQIGAQRLVDASQMEEACSMARLAVGADPLGRLAMCQTCGEGSLQLETLDEMIDTGVRLAKKWHAEVARAVAGLPS